MRIGLIAGEFSPQQGGLGDFTRELGRALVRAGHSAHVLAPALPGAASRETLDGLSITRGVSGWGWRTPAALARFAAANRIEVLNLQYQAAAYAMHPAINLLPKLLRGTPPLVVTFHDLRAPYLFPKAGPLRARSILALARGAAGTIVTNPEDEAILHAAGLTRVRAIPIGSNIRPADLPDFDVMAWRAARHIPAQAALIGYFGFLNESKGGEVLLRALAALRAQQRDVALLLVGGQTGASDATNVAYARRLEALIASLGLDGRVFRTGFIDDRGVSEAFAACTLFALPYRDGVSLRRGTLMAAFAHGSAIVTTTPRVPLPQLPPGEAYALVPPDDAPALASAIGALLDDPDRLAHLRAGSLAASRHFGWDEIALQTRLALADFAKTGLD